jgi:hypothetical protein
MDRPAFPRTGSTPAASVTRARVRASLKCLGRWLIFAWVLAGCDLATDPLPPVPGLTGAGDGDSDTDSDADSDADSDTDTDSDSDTDTDTDTDTDSDADTDADSDADSDADTDADADSDAECTTGENRPCGTDVGECMEGRQLCEDGQWSACGGTGPAVEQCDGRDQDCDGVPDEQDADASAGCPAGDRCGDDQGSLVCYHEVDGLCLDHPCPGGYECKHGADGFGAYCGFCSNDLCLCTFCERTP